MIFFSSVLYLLLWAGAAGKGSLAAFVAVFCALIGNPDRFQKFRFSLSGVETEARATIQRAQLTIDQLRNLATTLAEGSLTELAFSGMIFVGMSSEEKFQIRDSIVDRLHDIGVKSDNILKAQRIWIQVYCGILKGLVVGAVLKAVPNADSGKETDLDQLARETGKNGLPAPDALTKWVSTKVVRDPTIDQLLQEYENVWTTGTMRRPEMIPFGSMPSVPNLAALPTSPKGLAPGDTWNNGGVLSTVP